MDQLKQAAAEYFALRDKCDGTAKTFAALYPQVEALARRVEEIRRKAKSREVKYFASKLHQDVSDMERRLWRYTVQ